jgi:hypothetical protein
MSVSGLICRSASGPHADSHKVADALLREADRLRKTATKLDEIAGRILRGLEK